jgi:hypothetical protein
MAKVIPLADSGGTQRATARMRAMIRPLVAIAIAPVGVFAVLFWLSRAWYNVDLSGVPDEGQVPAQILPWFLIHYRSGGGLWSDPMRVTVWVTASLAYALPAALALFVARSRTSIAAAVVVVASLVVWACVSIPQPPAPSEWVTYFTRDTVRSGRAWIAGLAAGGALVGTVARILLSRIRRLRAPKGR